MNILLVLLFSPGTSYTGWALGLSIFSLLLSSASQLGFVFAPLIYASFWVPETFAGLDEMSIFKMLYMKVLSLLANLGSSVETLNYAIAL